MKCKPSECVDVTSFGSRQRLIEMSPVNSTKASTEVRQFPLDEEFEKQTGISPQDIAKLRDWLHSQPHLPADHITDLDIILAYHCCNCSAEVSKQVLDLQFTLRTLFTGFFKDRVLDEKIIDTLNTILIKPLPTRSREGYACLYGRLLDLNPKKFVFVDCVRAAHMVLDLWQYEEGTWPGFIMIYDMAGLTLAHLAALDIQTLQQYLYYVQEALLLKLKSVHILNAPPIIDKLMTLVKPFLKKEIIELLHIHMVGSRTIDKFYPIDALPKDAGGKYKSFVECRDETLEKVRGGTVYFTQDNKKRVVESQRPGKPKTVEDIFGSVLGSFKKLDID